MSGKLGPSVYEGQLRYLSVSQLNAYDEASYGGCARRWWFKYIGNQSEPEKGSQKLGKQVHSQIEHYLKTGEDVLGEVARAGKRFLPAPGKDLRVEWGFGRQVEGSIVSPLTAAAAPFVGFIDLLNPRGEWLDDDGKAYVKQGETEVVDWKTTKQIEDEIDTVTGLTVKRGYAKSAIEIANTWQMVGYGELARRLGSRSVRLGHGYFQTTGKRAALKRTMSVSCDEIESRWARADSLVESMRSTASEKSVENVKANYAACNAYGGCPHRVRCPRDAKAALINLFGGGHGMSLLEKLRAKSSGTPVVGLVVPATGPAPEKIIMKSFPKVEVDAEIERIKAEEMAVFKKITPPDMPAPKNIADPIPPEAVVSPAIRAAATAIAGASSSVTTAFPGDPCPLAGTQSDLTIDEVAAKKRACVCGAALKLKPAKLGDGKWYSLVPKHVVPGVPATVEPTTKEVLDGALKGFQHQILTYTPEVAQTIAKAFDEAEASPSLTLYLDAIEDGVSARRLETYTEGLCAALCAEYKAADVRCAPNDSALAYAKYKGALAACAKATPPESGAWAVSSGSELGMIVFEALAPSARVVRGVK